MARCFAEFYRFLRAEAHVKREPEAACARVVGLGTITRFCTPNQFGRVIAVPIQASGPCAWRRIRGVILAAIVVDKATAIFPEQLRQR